MPPQEVVSEGSQALENTRHATSVRVRRQSFSGVLTTARRRRNQPPATFHEKFVQYFCKHL
jgi:hypothetical protein